MKEKKLIADIIVGILATIGFITIISILAYSMKLRIFPFKVVSKYDNTLCEVQDTAYRLSQKHLHIYNTSFYKCHKRLKGCIASK